MSMKEGDTEEARKLTTKKEFCFVLEILSSTWYLLDDYYYYYYYLEGPVSIIN